MILIEAATVSSLLGDVGTIAGIVGALAAALLAALVLSQGRTIAQLRGDLEFEADRAAEAEAALATEVAAARRSVPAQAQPVAVPHAAAVAAAVPVVSRAATARSGGWSAGAMPALGSATSAAAIAAAAVRQRPAGTGPIAPAAAVRPAPVVIPAPTQVPAASVAAVRSDATATRIGEPSTIAAGGISRTARPPAPEPKPAKRRSPLIWVVAALVVAGIAAFAVTSLGGSDSSSSSTSATTANPSTGQSAAGSIVAVLNGTPVSGLAGQVSQELAKAGFKRGTVATARDQQQATTVVSYLPGHLTDAEAVSQSLGIKAAPVAADDATQSIACPDSATCNVDVIVTVGSDRAR